MSTEERRGLSDDDEVGGLDSGFEVVDSGGLEVLDSGGLEGSEGLRGSLGMISLMTEVV